MTPKAEIVFVFTDSQIVNLLVFSGLKEGLTEIGYVCHIERLLVHLGWEKDAYGCWTFDSQEAALYGQRYNLWRAFSDELLLLLEMGAEYAIVRNH